jgi:fermentation-respiration switch protein FrsA (DUF1100 family)
MTMRQDIEFDAEGVTLRGWLYLPDGATGPVSTVVMAHGFSAVKEMYLDSFAEAFAGGGLGALVFDNRNFGASGGEPRQEIDPWAQVRDYRHAITYAQTRSEVKADRIGVWGTSYSGGHVLVLGAIDKRVKCVVAQVPLVSGMRNIQRLVRQDFLAPNRAAFDQDRAAASVARPRRWCPWWTPTRWPSRPYPPPTPGNGSVRPARAGRRRGRTRSPCAPSRC